MTRKFAIGITVLVLSVHGASTSMATVSNASLDADWSDATPSDPPALPDRTDVAVPVQANVSPPAPIAPAAEQALSANPLWAMPLAQFPITRERPIFSSSRRPPPPAVAPVAAPKVAAVPKPKEPERPSLTLVGTAASDEEGFGIFLDQATKAVFRLGVGEDYQGWKLRSVQGRETTLEKDQQVVPLALPQPSGEQLAIEVPLPEANAIKLLSIDR
jgi:general secretion pathway protein N